jgi:predicted amidohydrolase
VDARTEPFDRNLHMSHPVVVRVAAAQYPIELIPSWDSFQTKLQGWVSKAVEGGAELLVFPEYAAMELASMFERRSNRTRRSPPRYTLGSLPVTRAERRERPGLEREAQVMQALLPAFWGIHAELARRHRVYILAGSLPVRGADGALRNTAYFFGPDGTMGSQEKIVLTGWERECWGLASGKEVRCFDTRFGPIGVAICYDVEFPLIARMQAEARARIILAPCCTTSLRGHHRVRVGAQARALENQAYVIQAPTVGDAPWSTSVDCNVGTAGIYAPPDLGPREDGIIAQGKLNVPQWIYADLNLAAVDRIRPNGILANQDDWTLHLSVGAAVAGEFRSVDLTASVPDRQHKLSA